VAETLRTARLRLRPWTPDNAGLLRRLSADPRVVRHVGDGQVWSDSRAQETSDRIIEHWRRHDFGWRVMELSRTGEEIGLTALNHPREETGLEPSEFEIGWWLAPEFWRRGLTGEAAEAVRDEAFERLRAPSLVARLQPANIGSAAVARRIGMSHERDTIGLWGEAVAIYRGLAPGP
jgi:RimJ/RimL family protein N-acetyltransferase